MFLFLLLDLEHYSIFVFDPIGLWPLQSGMMIFHEILHYNHDSEWGCSLWCVTWPVPMRLDTSMVPLYGRVSGGLPTFSLILDLKCTCPSDPQEKKIS